MISVDSDGRHARWRKRIRQAAITRAAADGKAGPQEQGPGGRTAHGLVLEYAAPIAAANGASPAASPDNRRPV